ncbi:hypothetical protein [Pseudonocardia acaciae]|uniref:hypothetical protein n=1 Tax=Pseudonocardia acaciae TaxID=551276 RepID=UPI000491A906|nr:hypothetical protein [Pseudonocardia acaciae]
MTRHTTPDPIDAAAWFVAGQPGATARILERHTAREDGSCAGCGVYRPVRWPCVLVHIARRAKKISSAADKDAPPGPKRWAWCGRTAA